MAKKLYSYRFDEERVIEPLKKAIAKSNGKYRDLTHFFEVKAMEFIAKLKR